MIKKHAFSYFVVILSLGGAAFCTRLLYVDVYVNTSRIDGLIEAGFIKEKNETVKRKLSDNMIWDLMKKNDKLFWDDSIQTSDRAQTVISLKGGGEIKLGSSSLVILAKDNDQLSLDLKSGQLVIEGQDSSLLTEIKINGVAMKTGGRKTLALNIDEKKGRLTATSTEADGTGKQVIVNKDGTVEEKIIPVTLDAPSALMRKLIDGKIENVTFKWNSRSDIHSLEISQDKDFTRLISKTSSDKKFVIVPLELGQYFWRVRDLTTKKEIISEVRSIDIVQMQAPKLLDPAPKRKLSFHGEIPSVEFTWESSFNANSYLIEISHDSDFKEVFYKDDTAKTSLKTSRLTEGPIFWRVSAIYGEDRKPSSISEFEIKKSLETNPPQLISPETRLSIAMEFFQNNKGVTFKWSHQDLEIHKFVLSKDVDLKGEPLLGLETTEDEMLYKEKLEPGTYFWSVGYQDVGGVWLFKEIRSFTIQPPTPLLPSPKLLTSKTEFNVADDGNISLKWAPVQGAIEYKFRLVKIGNKESKSFEDVTLKELETTKTDLQDGNYKWLVAAIDQYGRESKSSEKSFHVIHNKKLDSPEFDMQGVQ